MNGMLNPHIEKNPNTGAPYFIKQTLLDVKLQINATMVTVDDFNAPFYQ